MDKPEKFGKFLLLERVATGGMAEIFLAKAPGADGISKFLAIKRILPHYSNNTDFIDMFKSEAKICVNLTHSNIVPIYEFGIQNKLFFLVMEFVEGKNLRQILNKIKKTSAKPFDIDHIAYLAKEVCAGLDYAHRCVDGASGKPLNIIHRDMSPQNIIVSYEGGVKVIDFGIAKAESQSEATRAGTIKGKFSYMSPEQATALPLDPRTDLYSLGIILWEMLAGERLFQGSNEINILKKIRESQIPSIKKLNPKVPDELEKIVNKSLSKHRENRYETAAEFYKELNSFLNRFYPDFSSHDFSKKIKSLYTDEIVALRQKLVKFSKTKIEYSQSPEKTEITQTETDIRPTKPNLFESSSKKSKTQTKIEFSNIGIEGIPRRNIQITKTHNKKVSLNNNIDFKKIIIAILLFGIIGFGLNKFYNLFIGSESNSLSDVSELNDDLTDNTLEGVFDVFVNSSPSGARIYMDGVDSNKLTPHMFQINQNEAFRVTLKLDNYLDYSDTFEAVQDGFKVEATLQKAAVAYLNIDTPTLKDIIFIDGVQLRERLPLRNYRVNPGQVINIKIVNQERGYTIEESITLEVGETKDLRLMP